MLRTIIQTELRQLARDRRALFAAVLLPALLYPLLFWGSQKLEDVGRDTMAKREVVALVDFARAAQGDEGEAARRARTALADLEPIQVRTVDAQELVVAAEAYDAAREESEERAEPRSGPSEDDLRALALELLGEDGHVLVTARTVLEGEAEDVPRTRFELWFDVQSDTAREGVGRARRGLGELKSELRTEARERLLGGDPGAGLDARVVDVASAEDTSGAALGRWLPFLAMLVLLSGGAYAALAVFAGEREAGTLETLLVQPVHHRDVARGKFIAVCIAGVITVAVNLTSLVVCTQTGLAEMPGFEGATGGTLPLDRLLLGALVLVPASALLCALLCLGCGRAKTFREGQMLILPITFLVLVPTAIVLRPEAELGVLWALVPFAGSGLALREALEGDLVLGLGALVVASHLGWTFLLLARVADMLDGERALRDADGAAAGSLRARARNHAQLGAFAFVMANYLVAGAVQRADLETGLVFTFWIQLPLFIVGLAWLAPKPEGTRGWLGELRLGAPAPWHVLGALLIVPGLAWAAQRFIVFQYEVLPMPAESIEATAGAGLFDGRSTLFLFFFLALSPGLMEELLFRGTLLSSMRRGMTACKIALFQGLWFSFAHANVYRLAPTFILGVLFTIVALRARSVWPTVIAHTAYNGLLVLGSTSADQPARLPGWLLQDWLPWLAIPGVILLALPSWRRAEDECVSS